MRLRLVSCLVVLFALSAPLRSDPASDATTKQLSAQLTNLGSAIDQKDYATVASMLDQDFRMSSVRGKVLNRDQFMDALKATPQQIQDYKVQLALKSLEENGKAATGNVAEVSTATIGKEDSEQAISGGSKYDYTWHKVGDKWLINSINQTTYFMAIIPEPTSENGGSRPGLAPAIYSFSSIGNLTLGAKKEEISFVDLTLSKDGKFILTSFGPAHTQGLEMKGTWKEVNGNKVALSVEPSPTGVKRQGKGEVLFGKNSYPCAVSVQTSGQKPADALRLEISINE